MTDTESQWPDTAPATITGKHLSTWPVLRLLFGEPRPLPLPAADIVMPVNSMGVEGGLVCSGYALPDMTRALVWGLAQRYGHSGGFPPGELLDIIGQALAGEAVNGAWRHSLGEGIEVAVRYLNKLPLCEGYSLELGGEIPDLDLNLDEVFEPVAPPPATPRQVAPTPEKNKEKGALSPERFRVEQAGVVLTASGEEGPTDVAMRTLALAVEYGHSARDRNLTRLLADGRAAATLTEGEVKLAYRHMLDALNALNARAAPQGYAFAFERGELHLRQRDRLYATDDVEVILRADDRSAHPMQDTALRTIVLARWHGMKLPASWVASMWKIDADLSGAVAARLLPNMPTLLDVADDALDWLVANTAAEGCEFEIDDNDDLVVFKK